MVTLPESVNFRELAFVEPELAISMPPELAERIRVAVLRAPLASMPPALSLAVRESEAAELGATLMLQQQISMPAQRALTSAAPIASMPAP